MNSLQTESAIEEHEYACDCPEHAAACRSGNARSRLSAMGAGWLRFLGSWMGIGALWSGTTVCPCCGQPVCPVGIGFAALVGLLGATFFQLLRLWGRLSGGT